MRTTPESRAAMAARAEAAIQGPVEADGYFMPHARHDVSDLLADLAEQAKRIDALEKELAEALEDHQSKRGSRRADVGESMKTTPEKGKQMGSYRKKPVVIEAIQASEALRCAESEWTSLPEWLRYAYADGNVSFAREAVHLSTLEGEMRADPGDWIICGIKGEVYPCKPDIFALTYEPVDGSRETKATSASTEWSEADLDQWTALADPDPVARLKQRIEALEGALRDLLASARPHPVENPAMTRAWYAARALLAGGKEVGDVHS